MTERDVAVRWQDFDPLGHVRHATFLEYLEQARNAMLAEHGVGAADHVIAQATINYRREIIPTMRVVTASSSVLAIGTSSVTTADELRDDGGELLAEATAVVVLWDPVARGPRPLSPAQRASLGGVTA